MKLSKKRLMELSGINEVNKTSSEAASEMLSLLAHPDMKRNMDDLSDLVDDQQFMALKKLYDELYAELKKYE